jgi:hypothetical protein
MSNTLSSGLTRSLLETRGFRALLGSFRPASAWASKTEHMRAGKSGVLCGMAKHMHGSDSERPHILSAEKDGKDGVLVRFSDGTITGYVVEELLPLRPVREKVEESKAP